MPHIILTRDQVEQLVTFCTAAKSEQYFLAKDQGAYVGYSVGAQPHEQCIYYFEGCDPNKDRDVYDNADAEFGLDAVGYHFPLDDLRGVLKTPGCKYVRISITNGRLSIAAGR